MIGELIGDWIKGILIDGIMGNLSGLFSTVNTKVGEIASDVGTTPQAWNSGIFNMLQSLSDTVIVPIAAAILAVIMCYELIDMIVEKNNIYQKSLRDNPEMAQAVKNPVARFWQKQKIKRDYAKAARAAGQTAQGAASATKTTAAAAKKAAEKSKQAASFVARHWKGVLLIGGVGLIKNEYSVGNCRETERRPQHCGRDRCGSEKGRLHGGKRLSSELVYRPPCFPCRRRSL